MISISAEEFSGFAAFVKANYGIHLKTEKMAMIAGRLNQVILNHNFSNLTDYMNYVKTDRTGQAELILVDRITTNHTFFMREIEHFRFFRERVLPYLEGTVKNRDLRIWSAACSTGEEPATLVMIMDEFFGTAKSAWDTKILATDLSVGVLETARKGVYANEKLESLPALWKMQYFREHGAGYSILADKIKQELIYRRMNLMNSVYPFRNKFHAIFCKNVMIYFDDRTKEELVERLYGILEYGGYLFIGQSEALDRRKTKFAYVKPGVFRKE